jgi:hypothetical protein
MKINQMTLAAFVVLSHPGVALAQSSTLLATVVGKHDTGHTIALSADVKCTQAASYDLWSTSEGAKKFFAPEADIGGKIGGPYTIAFFPGDDPHGERHGTLGAHVLARDPPNFFAFEWVVFAGDDTKGNSAPPYAPESLRRPKVLPTWVELTFTSKAQGTHVEFRHFGFGGTKLWHQSQAWFTRAWGGVLSEMKMYCEAKH